MAYATIEDYEARNGEVSDPDRRAMVVTRLGDAATMLDTLVTVDPTDELQAAALRIASCNMVARTMTAADAGLAGLSEVSYGMGPFSQRGTISNPGGDMYLTASERRMLGIGATAIGSIRAQAVVPPC